MREGGTKNISYCFPPLISPAPSEPISIEVDGISSFALNIRWMPPVDNGGRPVQQYRFSIVNLPDLNNKPSRSRFYKSTD